MESTRRSETYYKVDLHSKDGRIDIMATNTHHSNSGAFVARLRNLRGHQLRNGHCSLNSNCK